MEKRATLQAHGFIICKADRGKHIGCGQKKTPISIQLTGAYQWTSQGLNLGPPDYENDKMIFCDSQRF